MGFDQIVLQPLHCGDVEMRGGLVHNEQIAVIRLDDDPREHDLGALASGEGGHHPLHDILGQSDLLQGGDLVGLVVLIGLCQLGFEIGVLLCEGVPVDVPAGHHDVLDLPEPAADRLDMPVGPSEDLAHGDIPGLRELLQIPDALGLLYQLAGVGLLLAQENAQERGLPCSVDPYQSYAVPFVDLETYILQDLDGTEGLGDGLGLQEHIRVERVAV